MHNGGPRPDRNNRDSRARGEETKRDSRVSANDGGVAVTELQDAAREERGGIVSHASQSRLTDRSKGFSTTARRGETTMLLTEAFPIEDTSPAG